MTIAPRSRFPTTGYAPRALVGFPPLTVIGSSASLADGRLVLRTALPSSAYASPSKCNRKVQVYAVDDDPDITWLYTMLLEEQGYEVRAFHDRMVALSALRADRKCPALLITDYAGCSMQVTEFMESCRAIQPNLRILMITGFYPTDLYLPGIRPDRILQKPFDLKVLGNEVGAVLRSRWPFSDPTACQQHQE